MTRRLWICSFRRSGNHWLQALLHENFGDIALAKAHLLWDDVLALKDRGDPALYLVRDPADVMSSNYDWALHSGEALRDQRGWLTAPASFAEFLRRPRRFCIGSTKERRELPVAVRHRRLYGDHGVLDYWREHVRRGRAAALVLRYEDLKRDLAAALERVAALIGRPLRRVRPVERLVGHRARRGLVGAGRQMFDARDRALLDVKLGAELEWLGYAPVGEAAPQRLGEAVVSAVGLWTEPPHERLRLQVCNQGAAPLGDLRLRIRAVCPPAAEPLVDPAVPALRLEPLPGHRSRVISLPVPAELLRRVAGPGEHCELLVGVHADGQCLAPLVRFPITVQPC